MQRPGGCRLSNHCCVHLQSTSQGGVGAEGLPIRKEGLACSGGQLSAAKMAGPPAKETGSLGPSRHDLVPLSAPGVWVPTLAMALVFLWFTYRPCSAKIFSKMSTTCWTCFGFSPQTYTSSIYPEVW